MNTEDHTCQEVEPLRFPSFGSFVFGKHYPCLFKDLIVDDWK